MGFASFLFFRASHPKGPLVLIRENYSSFIVNGNVLVVFVVVFNI